MTLKEFVDTYNGKKVDFDGAFGAQCVDLFRQYNHDVFGLPHTGAVEGAIQLYTNYPKLPVEAGYYDRIEYSGNIPLEGDAVIFGETSKNKYGHVAIVLYATKSEIVVFEQTGAHIGTWDYTRCKGFLRRRK
ncbi:hypothetical protein AGMMS50212_17210 [Spirochaetia bacterium]|nr:hypothetical protein AGMMS50212_17210 [Spirochaetia bacterium]